MSSNNNTSYIKGHLIPGTRDFIEGEYQVENIQINQNMVGDNESNLLPIKSFHLELNNNPKTKYILKFETKFTCGCPCLEVQAEKEDQDDENSLVEHTYHGKHFTFNNLISIFLLNSSLYHKIDEIRTNVIDKLISTKTASLYYEDYNLIVKIQEKRGIGDQFYYFNLPKISQPYDKDSAINKLIDRIKNIKQKNSEELEKVRISLGIEANKNNELKKYNQSLNQKCNYLNNENNQLRNMRNQYQMQINYLLNENNSLKNIINKLNQGN